MSLTSWMINICNRKEGAYMSYYCFHECCYSIIIYIFLGVQGMLPGFELMVLLLKQISATSSADVSQCLLLVSYRHVSNLKLDTRRLKNKYNFWPSSSLHLFPLNPQLWIDRTNSFKPFHIAALTSRICLLAADSPLISIFPFQLLNPALISTLLQLRPRESQRRDFKHKHILPQESISTRHCYSGFVQ